MSRDGLLVRFLGLLSLRKTKRVLARAVKAIDSSQLADLVLQRLIEFFEYLDVCRNEASTAEVEEFINTVLATLVPFVAKAPAEQVIAKIELLQTKSNLAWLISNKAGIVLCCILFSRLEILKTAQTSFADDASSLMASEIPADPMLHFFDAVQDRLADVFAGPSDGPDADFYGWQLMALLAMNVDADRKRAMVMELRERILAVVQRSEATAVAHLNIFLNALGLDASQLTL